MTAAIELRGVSRRFGSVKALENVSFAVAPGEFFALLGPSGSGKTTCLRLIAGFDRPTQGSVLLDGEDVTATPPFGRNVNTVFQDYALFPHMSVADNVAYGLKVRGVPASVRRRRALEVLALVRLEALAGRRPGQLSGGQKQRVALARALINQPKVLLLDEPLGALDLRLREEMQTELKALQHRLGITFVYVTHDQGEAMSLSDRIAVMNRGKVEQLGTPTEIYEAPESSFVAAFIGDTNFFEGTVAEMVGREYSRLEIDGFPDVLVFNDKQLKTGDLVYLSVRPEKIRISRDRPEGGSHSNVFPARVEDVVYLGSHTRYWVRVADYRISVYQQHNRFLLDETPIRWGEEVFIRWHADDGFMLERYSESDERLMGTPPEEVGERDDDGEVSPTGTHGA